MSTWRVVSISYAWIFFGQFWKVWIRTMFESLQILARKKLLRKVSWKLNTMCLRGDWTSPGDPNFLLSGAHPPSTGKRDNPAYVRSGLNSHDFHIVGSKLIHPVLGGASNIFLFFTPNLGKIRSNLTSIFFKQSGVSPSGRVVGVSIPIIYNPRNLERAPKPENLIALATSKTGSVWIFYWKVRRFLFRNSLWIGFERARGPFPSHGELRLRLFFARLSWAPTFVASIFITHTNALYVC